MKRTNKKKMLALCALVLFPLSTVVVVPKRATAQEIEPQAAAGSLDPSFGNGGIVTTDFFGHLDDPEAVAVQPDGKIVVAGIALSTTQFSTADFAVARYNHDGSLDSSFGAGGKATTDFFQDDDAASSMALQPDGKIVVVGSATMSPTKRVAALVRYNSDGSLDAGFGAGGKATMDFGGDLSTASAVALQSDGKILITGVLTDAQHTFASMVLARLTSSGAPDGSFGSAGMTGGPSISKGFSPLGVAIQSDGKIVVSGTAGGDTAASRVFAALRYNANGTLDTDFGPGGFVTTTFFGHGDVGDVVLLKAGGPIIVVGSAATDTQGDYDFAVVRYNVDGTLDSSFGTGGKVTTAFPGGKARRLGPPFRRTARSSQRAISGPQVQRWGLSPWLDTIPMAVSI
jgi:uncharacterized delta-60 repeat protein